MHCKNFAKLRPSVRAVKLNVDELSNKDTNISSFFEKKAIENTFGLNNKKKTNYLNLPPSSLTSGIIEIVINLAPKNHKQLVTTSLVSERQKTLILHFQSPGPRKLITSLKLNTNGIDKIEACPRLLDIENFIFNKRSVFPRL